MRGRRVPVGSFPLTFLRRTDQREASVLRRPRTVQVRAFNSDLRRDGSD